MRKRTKPAQLEPSCETFDYSAPEAQWAMDNVTALLLEVREEYLPMERKLRLYERTLGLAVLPVLIRRMFVVAARMVRGGRAGDRR